MQGSTQPDAARLRSPHLLPGQLSPSSSHSHVMSSTANWANSQGTIALAVHTGNSTPACHHAHLPHVTMLIHLHHLVRERHSHLHAGCRTCPTSCVLVRPSSHRHCCRPVLSRLRQPRSSDACRRPVHGWSARCSRGYTSCVALCPPHVLLLVCHVSVTARSISR